MKTKAPRANKTYVDKLIATLKEQREETKAWARAHPKDQALWNTVSYITSNTDYLITLITPQNAVVAKLAREIGQSRVLAWTLANIVPAADKHHATVQRLSRARQKITRDRYFELKERFDGNITMMAREFGVSRQGMQKAKKKHEARKK